MVQALGLMAGIVDCAFGASDHSWGSLVVGGLGIIYMFIALVVADIDDKAK